MSIGEEAEKRRKKIGKLKKTRRLLALGKIKSTALAVKSAKSQSIAQQQSGEFNPNDFYYVAPFKEVRVEGIPGESLNIIDRRTRKIVGELCGNSFENRGIPGATWDGSELKIGGKVFIKSIYMKKHQI